MIPTELYCVLGVKYFNNFRGYFNLNRTSLTLFLKQHPLFLLFIISYFILLYGFCIIDTITILVYFSTLLYPLVFYYTFLVKCTKLGVRTSLKRPLEQKLMFSYSIPFRSWIVVYRSMQEGITVSHVSISVIDKRVILCAFQWREGFHIMARFSVLFSFFFFSPRIRKLLRTISWEHILCIKSIGYWALSSFSIPKHFIVTSRYGWYIYLHCVNFAF